MRTQTLIPAALVAAALLAAGCGDSTKPSTADTFAAKAADEAKKQPTETSTTAQLPAATKVTPGPGEDDLSKKPKIPAQSGAAPTKLVVQDVVVGKGPQAKSGDQVTVDYVGVLFKGGKEFDTSWGKQPFDFKIGAGNVIQGWDQGVPGMRVGGRRRLIIPGDLAYGAQGSPPTIPANAALVFDIDLKKVNGKAS